MHSPEGGKEFLSVMVDPCSNDSLMWAEDSRNDLTYQNGLKGGSIFEKPTPALQPLGSFWCTPQRKVGPLPFENYQTKNKSTYKSGN